jgi:cytochrome c-type biogenesis protein CcmH
MFATGRKGPSAPLRSGRGDDKKTVTPSEAPQARSGGASSSWLALLVALLLSFPALSVEPSEMLSDPALEARAREIGQSLRCVVCQNQSIDDSAAEVAHDMRRAVRERLTAGDSNDQVFAYMVARYGDYVLLKPPFKAGTLVLWLGAPALLLIAAGALLLAARRRRVSLAPSPLSEDERERLEELLTPVASTEAPALSEAEGKRSGEAFSAAGKVSPRAHSALGRDDG